MLNAQLNCSYGAEKQLQREREVFKPRLTELDCIVDKRARAERGSSDSASRSHDREAGDIRHTAIAISSCPVEASTFRR